MPLARCFFDIAINGVATGRIVFELFSDIVPKTTENFRCLCTGERGEGKNTFKPLHFKGTPIHRIVKGFIVQGGDFSNGDGTGGESIYGGMFKDEGFQYKHDKPFLLSMANKGPNTNGSQFFITTRPAHHLDGIHVVFGHVIQGQQFVAEMENQKVDTNHRPYADVRIINSGELIRVTKGKKPAKKVVESSAESSEEDSSEVSSSEESSSEERRRRKQQRKKVAKKEKRAKRRKEKKTKASREKSKRKKPQRSESESEEGSSGTEDDHDVTSTVPDDLATPLPPELEHETTKSWLYRRSRTPSPIREERKKNKEKGVTSTRAETSGQFKPRKKHEVSHSGRKLKGRGLMRYKTPPRQFESSPPPRREQQRTWRYGDYRRDTWRRSRSRSRERRPQYHSKDQDNKDRKSRSRSRDRRSNSSDRVITRKQSPSRRASPDRNLSYTRETIRRHSPKERRRSHSRDRSDGRSREYERTSLRDTRRSEGERRRQRKSRSHSREKQEVPSKWARHHDSAESSSDEELERVYRGEEEDLFGLAKLSREMMT